MLVKWRICLFQLVEMYDFFILEDDVYGELGFIDILLFLKVMDYNGWVLYVGLLLKVIVLGMRIGWIVGNAVFIKVLLWFKKDLDYLFF